MALEILNTGIDIAMFAVFAYAFYRLLHVAIKARGTPYTSVAGPFLIGFGMLFLARFYYMFHKYVALGGVTPVADYNFVLMPIDITAGIVLLYSVHSLYNLEFISSGFMEEMNDGS